MPSRTWTRILICLTPLAVGCVRDHKTEQLNDRADQNRWIVEGRYEDHVRAAVVAEATIYPHHFETGRAELNELGWRDLVYLAEHFADRSGHLNVRRTSEDDALYAQRVATVRAALAEAGIGADRLQVEDGMPGGPGLGAQRILYVLKQDTQPLKKAENASGVSESKSKGGDQ